MGILTPSCIAGNGAAMFGISVETNYAQGADPTPRVLLIKSNDNPSSLASIRWDIISTVQIGAVYNISNTQNPQCNIDEKGVFTYLDLSVIKAPGGLPMTGGIRYSPAYPANADGTSTGPGGWKNIDTAGPYPWEATSGGAVAFDVPDAAGNNVMIQTWAVGYTSSLQFGYLDNTSLQLQTGPLWKFPTSLSIIHKTYYNKTFFLLFRESSNGTDVYGLLTIPFNNSVIAPAPPANFTGYKMSYNGTSIPMVTGFFLDNFYTVRRFNNGTAIDTLAVINFANVTGAKFRDEVNLTQPINTFIPNMRRASWCALGGADGSPTLGYFNRIDFGNSSHQEAVHLDGPKIGQWEYVPWKLNVSETFGKYLYPPPRRTGPPEDSSSGVSTGLVVGCVVGGLAIIGVAVFLFIFYSRRMTRQLNEANSAKEQDQHQEDHSRQNIKQEAYEIHSTSLPPTTVAAAAAVAPPGSSLQQQINLSSHPRPTMVSTFEDQTRGDKAEIEEEPSTSSASQSFYTPPWTTQATYQSDGQSFQSSPLASSQVFTPQVPLHSRPPQS